MKRSPYVHIFILIAFLVNSIGSICPIARSAEVKEFLLPAPGQMVHLSQPLLPPLLKGIKVHPDNPFRFDFILDIGDGSKTSLQEESTRLIKYFLASLTIPEKDLWVNLSPYEKNRIIPQSFGITEMGRELLAEDYMLKQITASLIYPEEEIGKKFWKRIYEEAAKRFGTTNIPVNTFNKVWIVPEKAVVYENAKAGTAYIIESKLKVMQEQDYLSLYKHSIIRSDVASVGANIIREIVIPELTKEVNEGKNFAQLRQVYNSLILATWYKNKIKDSILMQVYTDKNKVAGVNINDPQEKQMIYERYLCAFKKGVFNYIKEDVVSIPGMSRKDEGILPRKYFSGGVLLGPNKAMLILENSKILNHATELSKGSFLIEMKADPAIPKNAAMNVMDTLHRLLETSEFDKDWVVDENDFTRELRAEGKLNATKKEILEDSIGSKDKIVQDQAFRRVIEDFILADDGSVLPEVFKVIGNEDITVEDIEHIKAGIVFPSSSANFSQGRASGLVTIKIIFNLKNGGSTFCFLRCNLGNLRSSEAVDIAEFGNDKIMTEPSGVINNDPWNFVSRAFRLEDGAIVRYGYVPSIRIFAPEVIKGYNSNMYRSADNYGQTVARARARLLSRLWKELTCDLGDNDRVLDFAIGQGRDLITEDENGRTKKLGPEIYKKIIAMDFMTSALERIRTDYPDIMTMRADWLHMPPAPAGIHVRRIFGLNAISYVPQSQLNAVITQLDQMLEPTVKGRKEMTFLVDIQPGRDNFYSDQNKQTPSASTMQQVFRQQEIFRNEWIEALRGAFASQGYKLMVETKTEIVQGQAQVAHHPYSPNNVFSYGIGKFFQGEHKPSIPEGEVKEQLTVWVLKAIKKVPASSAMSVKSMDLTSIEVPVKDHAMGIFSLDMGYGKFFPGASYGMKLEHFLLDLLYHESIKDKSRGNVLYLGSGTDIAHPLVVTDGAVFDMVDLYVPSFEEFSRYDWDSIDFQQYNYIREKYRLGYTYVGFLKANFMACLVAELKSLGIYKKDVKATRIKGGFRIVFEKEFPGKPQKQEYTFNFIKENARHFKSDKMYDVLFQKAGWNEDGSYALNQEELVKLDRYLNKGAYILVNPYDIDHGERLQDGFDLLNHPQLHYKVVRLESIANHLADQLSDFYYSYPLGYGFRLHVYRKTGEFAMTVKDEKLQANIRENVEKAAANLLDWLVPKNGSLNAKTKIQLSQLAKANTHLKSFWDIFKMETSDLYHNGEMPIFVMGLLMGCASLAMGLFPATNPLWLRLPFLIFGSISILAPAIFFIILMFSFLKSAGDYFLYSAWYSPSRNDIHFLKSTSWNDPTAIDEVSHHEVVHFLNGNRLIKRDRLLASAVGLFSIAQSNAEYLMRNYPSFVKGYEEARGFVLKDDLQALRDWTRKFDVDYARNNTKEDYSLSQKLGGLAYFLQRLGADNGNLDLGKEFLRTIADDQDSVLALHLILKKKGLTKGVEYSSTISVPFRNIVANKGDIVQKLERQMKREKKSRAMINKTGGIDLTLANNVLKTANNGGEIKFHINQAMFKQLQNVPGFVPVIINIQPMTDLRKFLGIKETVGVSQGVG